MKLQLLTLAKDIFKLRTSKSFSQKGFTQVCRGQTNFDVRVAILSSLVLRSSIKNKDSTQKEVSRSLRLKFGHFKTILSWETSTEQWPLGLLSCTSNLLDSPQPETTDLCGYYRPNYFAILVLEMGLFSNACNRSQQYQIIIMIIIIIFIIIIIIIVIINNQQDNVS